MGTTNDSLPGSIASHKGFKTREWLRKLPKVELHLHLEGTVTPETLVILSQRHDEVPLTLAEAVALYDYTDFIHFLNTFRLVCDRLQTPEDYGLIVREMIKDLAGQGVVHAEVYLALGGVMRNRTYLNVGSVLAAVEDARIESEKTYGVSIVWIIDATRQYGAEACGQVFDVAAEWRAKYPSIVGIGIGGDESNGPCEQFANVYRIAKQRGLRLTAHAGESTGPIQGPKNVRDALAMGAERIGHGVCSVFDPELMALLKERQTPIEVSVTSNIRTGVCPDLQQHPIKAMIAGGLMVTLNSDDPAMFGSNLLDEYVLVQQEFGFTNMQMKELAGRAVQASFLLESKKVELLNMIAQVEN